MQKTKNYLLVVTLILTLVLGFLFTPSVGAQSKEDYAKHFCPLVRDTAEQQNCVRSILNEGLNDSRTRQFCIDTAGNPQTNEQAYNSCVSSVNTSFAAALAQDEQTRERLASENLDFGDKSCEAESLTTENCTIIEYLVTGINVLSALAGMAIVASIMFGGFQYMTARDNAGQIQQAKGRIIWALAALLIFLFMYAFLNFLVPGGVL